MKTSQTSKKTVKPYAFNSDAPTPDEYAAQMIAGEFAFNRYDIVKMSCREAGTAMVKRLKETGIVLSYNEEAFK